MATPPNRAAKTLRFFIDIVLFNMFITNLIIN
jgi:hypothetical protein